jgi:hypothetical protein
MLLTMGSSTETRTSRSTSERRRSATAAARSRSQRTPRAAKARARASPGSIEFERFAMREPRRQQTTTSLPSSHLSLLRLCAPAALRIRRGVLGAVQTHSYSQFREPRQQGTEAILPNVCSGAQQAARPQQTARLPASLELATEDSGSRFMRFMQTTTRRHTVRACGVCLSPVAN